MNKLFCTFRKESVVAQPEELVRQQLLSLMTQQLGYPKSYIVVEKALQQLPHLRHQHIQIPDRRVDLLCYTKIKDEEGLVPLLLIECKAIALQPKALQQVAGYNHFVGAPFLCVANASEIFTGWIDSNTQKFQFVDFLPSYNDLAERSFCRSATH